MTVTGVDCCALDASPWILSKHPSKKSYLFLFQEPSCITARLLQLQSSTYRHGTWASTRGTRLATWSPNGPSLFSLPEFRLYFEIWAGAPFVPSCARPSVGSFEVLIGKHKAQLWQGWKVRSRGILAAQAGFAGWEVFLQLMLKLG